MKSQATGIEQRFLQGPQLVPLTDGKPPTPEMLGKPRNLIELIECIKLDEIAADQVSLRPTACSFTVGKPPTLEIHGNLRNLVKSLEIVKIAAN